jgi:SRSO17 transposase
MVHDLFFHESLLLLCYKVLAGSRRLWFYSPMQGRANDTDTSEQRFAQYVEKLTTVIGHADRAEPLRAYCTGLLLPGGRKSVEPMAARIEPGNVRSRHQSLHHFIAEAPWSDAAVLEVVRDSVLPVLARHGGIAGWLVDDSGLPKKGKHSVGVARQYCGQLGKQENCQVAVSLSAATASASLPLAFQLYLPEGWAQDRARRRKGRIPAGVTFQTKPELALAQIEAAVAAGVPVAPVIADCGYGHETEFRERVTELGLRYAVGVQKTTTVWPPGRGPLPPAPWKGNGRPPTRLRRDAQHQPAAVAELARSLPPQAWRAVRWREGTRATLQSRFAAVRVRAAHRDDNRAQVRDEEWLLIEWPEGEKEPTKYFLSTLPKRTTLKQLVATVKLRWRIERDYEDLKQEIGLGHYEGRGWRGFHHHATLCIAAYAFLVAERGRFSPGGVGGRPRFTRPRVPRGFRPRGAPVPARTAQPDLDRHRPHALTPRSRPRAAPLPLLPAPGSEDLPSSGIGQRHVL